MNAILADAMSIANILLFGTLAIVCLLDLRVCMANAHPSWCWVKVAQLALGLYWCCLYVFILFANPHDYDPVAFGQIFVRPAFTLTAGVMLAGSIIGARRRGAIGGGKNDHN